MRMNLKSPYLPSVIVFCAFVFGFTLLNVLTPTKDVSVTERRTLAQPPELTWDSVVSGDYTEQFAAFMRDQAALRDPLRYLKSATERNVFRKLENNDVYVIDGFVFDKFYGIDDARAVAAAETMNEIIADLGEDDVFLSMIPTKAKGLTDDRYLLSDQHEIADVIRDSVDASYIDLMAFSDTDTQARYYGADPHWTTEGAIAAYEMLGVGLGFVPVTDYSLEEFTDEYVGSEYGRAAAWSVSLDTINLARNPVIDGMGLCRVVSVDQTDCFDSVYVEPGPDTVDDYDVFVGGLGPIIELTNPSPSVSGHLVVFKDSYAQALSPFLAQHYATVTLIDLRYVDRGYALDHVETDGATILFLYSTSVINTDPRALN